MCSNAFSEYKTDFLALLTEILEESSNQEKISEIAELMENKEDFLSNKSKIISILKSMNLSDEDLKMLLGLLEKMSSYAFDRSDLDLGLDSPSEKKIKQEEENNSYKFRM